MGETSIFPEVEQPFLTQTRYRTHARMLAASQRSLGGGASRFLITSFTHDRAGILFGLLNRLTEPVDLPSGPRIHGFTVDSSMSASLVRVGAMAVVVEPLMHPDNAETPADAEIVAYLQEQLAAAQGPTAEQLRARRAGFPPVTRLSPGDELNLYGGRVYREVRFGLQSGGERRADISREAAEKCARILRDFTAALKTYGTPIAFVHFPHGWRSNAPELSWLRIAYAVEQGVGADVATEVAAWNIACQEEVALSIYDPTRRELPYPQRYEHILPASVATLPTKRDHTGRRVSVCIEGMARTGLLADTIAGLYALPTSNHRPLALYGCTAGVLYGHTVTTLVIDADHGNQLWADPSKLSVTGGLGGGNVAVSVQMPDDDAPLMEEKSEAMFWVSWCCGEKPGVIRRIIAAVFDLFRQVEAENPNVLYAISRVLADGFTCAGKVKLSGDPHVIRQLGLHEPHNEKAKAETQATLTEAIADALEGWEPPDPAWKDRPIWLTESEPREEPWATLVVPEGATEGWS